MSYFYVLLGGQKVIDVDFNPSMSGYIGIAKFIMELTVHFERFVILVINCIGSIGTGMV